jgi:hypothetical protein
MNKEYVKTTAESIRQQYVEKSTVESKLDKLKRLDREVKKPAEIFAYTFGSCATLVMGAGMSLAMQVIGEGVLMMGIGIGVGIIGMGLMALTYPIYKNILQKRKAKYSEEILALSGELLNEN